ncbi:MAG TPA: ATP-binding protein [Solirubrobacteraceae bacterium]|jgi:two-component system sensor histidine kinase KdpD|nr:ATP-binding protein [Solirubrobacteraceae bacterium]
MPAPSLSPLVLRSPRPSAAAGALAAIGAIALETVAIYPLAHVTQVVSLGVVYLLGVVVVSTYWGIGFGLATAVLSALAFNYFHLPPLGRLTLADDRNWVALVSFIVVAAASGLVADLARTRAQEADVRRREADLATELARTLLASADLDAVLATAAQRLAASIGSPSASLELGVVSGGERHEAFTLHGEDGGVVATLLLPSAFAADNRARISERIVPALQSTLAAALVRAELQAEVVETAALRRNDELKTALLRSVSHDLRTPLTAIITAASAIEPQRGDAEELAEARSVVLEAATRLAGLVDKLLDLSRLQSGTGGGQVGAYSLEEVLAEAVEHAGDGALVQVSIDPDLPLLDGDPDQLERAFANLIENAVRYSAGKPVSVRARLVGDRVRVRVVDQGPGIAAGEVERIFLPFYRGAGDGHQGSGLGLAIAKGFIEVNGGRISVESLPGQTTSFVIEFPLQHAKAAA